MEKIRIGFIGLGIVFSIIMIADDIDILDNLIPIWLVSSICSGVFFGLAIIYRKKDKG